MRAEDLDRVLSIDVSRWRQEMGRREQHLAQFPDLPDELWQVHRRIAADLDSWTT
jgi:phosphoenolpyruvate carboxykinase (GTP)